VDRRAVQLGEEEQVTDEDETTSEAEDAQAPAVAIIGMAGRFPKSPDLERFWTNIAEGRDCVTFFTEDELRDAGVPPELFTSENYVPARAILDDPLAFDAEFFDFSPAEAKITDPQHRLFLESAYLALEDAGYDAERYDGLIGVFGGADVNSYALGQLLLWTHDLQGLIGNDKDYLATRVAFKLDLRGPALTIQTACSTSLVSIQIACQQLLSFQCDMALAGGVGVAFPQRVGYVYQPGGILSPDGRCRAFDASSQGTVGGDGCGLVVLKRLQDALQDGDAIRAVIRGAAINNDGRNKVGFTAPSVDGQAEVIAMAHAMADVPPESIGYVEAHGTGTQMGDPVEIAALNDVFSNGTSARNYCALGSVKSNMGHMNSAAGVAGLIKTVLALEHRQLPPSLHFEKPNPELDLEQSCFYVNTQLRDWVCDGPRRAAVSSFGVGGTNAHLVLEEAPLLKIEPSEPGREQLLLLSADNAAALEQIKCDFDQWIQANPDAELADVAWTLQQGRKLRPVCTWAVCEPGKVTTAVFRQARKAPQTPHQSVVYLFPGQGAQYVGMTRGLYQTETVFREWLDRCAEILRPLLEWDLRDVLFPEPGREHLAEEQLAKSYYAQASLFAVEYSLAQLWNSLGVEPVAFVGHSVGEYVAACLSGTFTLPDALALLVARGELAESLERGGMIVALTDEATAKEITGLEVAALNGPHVTVLSGAEGAIERAASKLKQRRIGYSVQAATRAFHSSMQDPILPKFRERVARLDLSRPKTPWVSNVTGDWIRTEEATDPNYWTHHFRRAVRFDDCLRTVLSDSGRMLLEVGPGNTLGTLARRHRDAMPDSVASSGRDRNQRCSDRSCLLHALARVAFNGVRLNWSSHHPAARTRLRLPKYAFQRIRYGQSFQALQGVVAATEQRLADPTQWLYYESWRRGLATSAEPASALRCGAADDSATQSAAWLVFADEHPLAVAMLAAVRGGARSVVVVKRSAEFAKGDDQLYTVNPTRPEHFDALLDALEKQGARPEYTLHLWNLSTESTERAAHETGVLTVVGWAQAVTRRGAAPGKNRHRISIVATGALNVLGGEPLLRSNAALSAMSRVLNQELSDVSVRLIDVPSDPAPASVAAVMAELTDSSEETVALRHGHPWVLGVEPLSARDDDLIEDDGVYLIAGGLGHIGLAVAEHFARRRRVRLVLVTRSGFLAPKEWDNWVAAHAAEDPVSRKIHRLRSIESGGTQVMTLSADIADPDRMREVVQQVNGRFGAIRGVVHAAGLVGGSAFRAVMDTTAVHFEGHLHAKRDGLEVLDAVVMPQARFCVVMSSLSTILGGVGLLAYSVANQQMDAYVHEKRRQGDKVWLALDWDAWATGTGAQGARTAISLAEAQRVLAGTFSEGMPGRTFVAKTALGQRLRQFRLAAAPASNLPGAEERHQRPDLATEYIAPRTDLEGRLAELWQEIFGIEKVGVVDNFFELGGDSLRAIQLSTRLRESLGVEVPVNDLFEEPTIESLARKLQQQLDEKPARAGIEETLELVNSLSDEEVREMLKELESSTRNGGAS
jgi:acyl transferase domain-containing protein/aryl carrier-like protein